MSHHGVRGWAITTGVLAIIILGNRLVIKELRRISRLREHGLRAPGSVTNEGFTTSGRHRQRYLQVTFTTPAGRTYSGQSTPGAASASLPKGAAVTVVYEAGNPRDFLLESDLGTFTPVLLLVLSWVTAAVIILLQVA